MFRWPNIWELSGVLLGVAGLVLPGVVVVQLSPNGLQVSMIFAGLFLLFITYRIWTHYRALRHYDFLFRKVDNLIEFTRKEINSATGRIVPRGCMTRTTRAATFRHSPPYYRRYQLVSDICPDPQAFTALPEHYEVSCSVDGKFSFIPWLNSRITRSHLKTVKLPHNFRRLNIDIELPDVVAGKAFTMEESFVLPNSFNEDEEFYSITVSEISKKRHLKIISREIEITDARIKLKNGAGQVSSTDVPVRREGSSWVFEKEFKNLKPGIEIEAWWRWNLTEAK